MHKRARVDGWLMAHRYDPNRRANTRPEYAQWPESLAFEPSQRPPHIEHRLPRRLHRQPNIWTDQMIRAQVARNRSLVVIGQAHLDGADSQALKPAADVLLLFPARIPLGQHNHRRPLTFCRK